MIDIEKLYRDFHIPYETRGHKHVGSPGWVGTPCPFCSGNPGYHLGYCTDPGSKYAGAFTCWRCGGKAVGKALEKILGIPEEKVWGIIKQYSSGVIPNKKPKPKKKAKECKLPPGTDKMTIRHHNYLKRRGFDSRKLEKVWNLLGTGPIGPYKHRIIIPIYFQGRIVSYQGRDMTDKSTLRYKACRQELEVIDHKNCLYGIDSVPGSSIVVVEGVTDVWRLGPGAVATFGIKFKEEQAQQLLAFKRIFLLYDSSNDDPQAGEQAEKLSNYLVSPNRYVEMIYLDSGDPGDLKDKEAKDLMADLIGREC